MSKIIKLKCRVCDSINLYKYVIKIYNKNNKLIINDCTDNNGVFKFNVRYYGLYKIIIINKKLLPKCKSIIMHINKNCQNEILVPFREKKLNKNHLITINLIDANYKNLPISKGKVILWEMSK